MQAEIAKHNDGRKPCRQCNRAIAVGEAMLMQRLDGEVSYNYRRLYWHADCVLGVIEKGPKPKNVRPRKRTFEEMREKIAAGAVWD